MTKLIQAVVSWGPAGVLLLAVLDSFGIPMIGGVDAVVVLVSILDHSRAYWSAAAAIVGSVIGSFGLFYIARKGGEAYLDRYTSRGRGRKFRAWFQEYGLVTVFVPAFVIVPLPMKIFVISAGALEVRPRTFGIVLTAARIPRYLFLAWLGTRLGYQTGPYLRQHIWEFGGLAVVLFIVLYLAIRLLHGKRPKRPIGSM